MKTATTLHKTAKGWVLKSGPDVAYGKQKAEFQAAQQSWPKDVLCIQFQANTGPARLLDNVKAQRLRESLLASEARAEAKVQLAKLQGEVDRVQVRVNELTPRVARQRELVESFNHKAKASKDTKFHEAHAHEHNQAIAQLKTLEKELSDAQAQLTKLQTQFNDTKSKV